MTHFAGLLGYQRCGTHMLGSAVDSHPDAIFAHEIFYYDAPFKHAVLEKALAQHDGETRLVLLDIKLNRITPIAEAFLKDIPVIMIYRSDRLRQYYSGELHHYRHHSNDSRYVDRRMSFELDKEKFTALKNDVDALYNRFQHLANLYLVYENLTNNQEIAYLADSYSYQICDLLGLERMRLEICMRKQAPPDIGGLLIHENIFCNTELEYNRAF